MMATKQEQLDAILSQLENTGGIVGSAVISRDGLVVTHHIPDNANAESFAALTATMTGAAETSVMVVGKGTPDRILVETESIKLITVGAGSELFLSVLASPEANLGLVFMEMKSTVEAIKGVVGG